MFTMCGKLASPMEKRIPLSHSARSTSPLDMPWGEGLRWACLACVGECAWRMCISAAGSEPRRRSGSGGGGGGGRVGSPLVEGVMIPRWLFVFRLLTLR